MSEHETPALLGNERCATSTTSKRIEPGEVPKKSVSSILTAEQVEQIARKRKHDTQRDVRCTITRLVPALRTQRKYRDANGNPLSVLAVLAQKTNDLLCPSEKKELQAKDFTEDEREDFEKVRLLFVNHLEAKDYFYTHKAIEGLEQYSAAAALRQAEVQAVEAKRRKLAHEDADPGMIIDEEHPDATGNDSKSVDRERYDYYEWDSPEGHKCFRLSKGIYVPQQMSEGMKEAIKGERNWTSSKFARH